MTLFVQLAGIVLLAAITEALVEFFAAPVVDLVRSRTPLAPERQDGTEPVDWFDIGLRCVSAAVGVILCVLYGADLLALAGLTAPLAPWLGAVVTGLLAGRGANFLHDFASKYLDAARS
jgi:hypothetical protein